MENDDLPTHNLIPFAVGESFEKSVQPPAGNIHGNVTDTEARALLRAKLTDTLNLN